MVGSVGMGVGGLVVAVGCVSLVLEFLLFLPTSERANGQRHIRDEMRLDEVR